MTGSHEGWERCTVGATSLLRLAGKKSLESQNWFGFEGAVIFAEVHDWLRAFFCGWIDLLCFWSYRAMLQDMDPE